VEYTYTVLSNPEKRREYDSYIRMSSAIRTSLLSGTGGSKLSKNVLFDNFNFLLWDIEYGIRRSMNPGARIYIMKILTFIDKWVLEPGGFPDYFMTARNKKKIDPANYILSLGKDIKSSGHAPFISIGGYFYNIRKRMNSFLDKITENDLSRELPGSPIRLIHCVVEAQNLTVYYLSFLLELKNDETEDIPPFKYTHPYFNK